MKAHKTTQAVNIHILLASDLCLMKRISVNITTFVLLFAVSKQTRLSVFLGLVV